MEKKWIYLLKDPRDNIPKYIGMSKDPKKRLKEHISDTKREQTKKSNWIRKLLSLKLLPILEILKETDEIDYKHWETFFIKKYTSEGYNLLNYDENGVGTSNGLKRNTIEKLQTKNTIKIIQYSLDGIKINTFKSLREAERETGINHGNISKCCDGKFNHAGGFIFKKDDYCGVITKIKHPNGIKKKIIELDSLGNIINEYQSISQASKETMIDGSNISRVCHGILKQTNNKIFKFKENE